MIFAATIGVLPAKTSIQKDDDWTDDFSTETPDLVATGVEDDKLRLICREP